MRTSLSVTQTQCAATSRSERNPIFSSHSTGRNPVFLRWLYTSARVSLRCVWIPTPLRSAASSLSLPDELLSFRAGPPPLRRKGLVEDDPREEGANPGLPRRAGNLVLPVEEVVERRRAGLQHLDGSEEGRHLDVPPGELSVDRECAFEHRLQRDVVRRPSQQRVRHVGVGIDQPRQDRAVRTVEDLVRRAPPLADLPA